VLAAQDQRDRAVADDRPEFAREEVEVVRDVVPGADVAGVVDAEVREAREAVASSGAPTTA